MIAWYGFLSFIKSVEVCFSSIGFESSLCNKRILALKLRHIMYPIQTKPYTLFPIILNWLPLIRQSHKRKGLLFHAYEKWYVDSVSGFLIKHRLKKLNGAQKKVVRRDESFGKQKRKARVKYLSICDNIRSFFQRILQIVLLLMLK